MKTEDSEPGINGGLSKKIPR